MRPQRLVDGFNRFRARYYKPDGTGLMNKLAKGTSPDSFVIHCIDPRSGAGTVFDAAPGQMFTHVQMGAIVPPYDAKKLPSLNASLAYAIDVKKIKHLVLLAHSDCGGIAALLDNVADKRIADWVETAAKAKSAAENKMGKSDHAALQAETERLSLAMSLKNLLEYPVVKQAVAEGRITVTGWLFNVEKGSLQEYDTVKDTFTTLPSPAPAHKFHRPHKHKM
jgi:carbonic anhydrase